MRVLRSIGLLGIVIGGLFVWNSLVSGATLTRGKTFIPTENVTNTKLHQLIDDGMVTNIIQSDIGSNYGLLYRSGTALTDTDSLFFNTTNNVLNVYGTASWVEIPTISSPTTNTTMYYNGTRWVTANSTSLFGGVVDTTSNQTVAGIKNFTSIPVLPASDPTDGNQSVRKAYADTTSKIVQIVNYQTGANATGTTVLPFDDTIPQKTEGDEYMTLAITPTNATNKLKIDVVWFGGTSTTAYYIGVALFQDAAADALAAGFNYDSTGSAPSMISFTHYMTAGTTSATTFRVRAGFQTSATLNFNGYGGGRKFGGVMASSITITEIKQ